MNPPLFHPGQEVICTNDDFTLLLVQNPNIQTPKRGPIYTVRGVYNTHRGYGLTLVEINNADVAPGFPEANFHESRFAPVPPLEQIDIAEALEQRVTAKHSLVQRTESSADSGWLFKRVLGASAAYLVLTLSLISTLRVTSIGCRFIC